MDHLELALNYHNIFTTFSAVVINVWGSDSQEGHFEVMEFHHPVVSSLWLHQQITPWGTFLVKLETKGFRMLLKNFDFEINY